MEGRGGGVASLNLLLNLLVLGGIQSPPVSISQAPDALGLKWFRVSLVSVSESDSQNCVVFQKRRMRI